MTESSQGPIRVLMLEDSALDAELITAQLKRARLPLEITRVWTHDTFVNAVDTGSFDVILADHVLPGFDGDTALTIAAERVPHIPFIFVSGTLTEELAVQALTRGARDYVVKQRLQRLPDAVLRAINEADEHRRLAAAEAEVQQSRDQLREINASLERQIQERTAALAQSERRLQAIFESSFQLQMLLAPEGVLLDANVASLSAILQRKEDVCGLPFADAPWFAGTPEAADTVRAMMQAAAAGNAPQHEFLLDLPTGQRSFDFSFRPLHDHLGHITAVVVEAVETTARRQAESALRQTQKIEAIGQLTGGIAHDFNNILTVISGNVEHAMLLNERLGEAAGRSTRSLDNALKGVERAAGLTQRLLAFARRQPLRNEPTDINARLLGMQDMLQRSLGEMVQLQLVTTADPWCVEVDTGQLEASILNLAVNARDAMPSGGRLVIEVDNVHVDDDVAARDPEVPPGQYVMLRVRDTGQGIPEDTIARVFEPFFTTKDVGRGTGLGLSMVYGFVRQSGGRVLIDSTIDRGTTVTMLFPRSAQTLPEAAGTAAPTDQRATSRDATILVAEDNDDVRAYTVETLRQLGYRVLEAHDGPSALRLLERPDVRVDLLFSDVVMPGMSGWELAQQAQERVPGLHVLFTSGYPRDIHARDASGQAVALLSKPFTRRELAQAVTTHLPPEAPARETVW